MRLASPNWCDDAQRNLGHVLAYFRRLDYRNRSWNHGGVFAVELGASQKTFRVGQRINFSVPASHWTGGDGECFIIATRRYRTMKHKDACGTESDRWYDAKSFPGRSFVGERRFVKSTNVFGTAAGNPHKRVPVPKRYRSAYLQGCPT
jgi:hypothetical protein